MYIPLQVRLTLFYALILGLALWFFGYMVYTQAEQRAYNDLDNALSSRANSVQLGKALACSDVTSTTLPFTLPSVDGLGTGGVAIEVLDNQMRLLATTAGNPNDPVQPGVNGLGSSPIPWDSNAAHKVLQIYNSSGGQPGLYSTITYQEQHVRVYTLVNICGPGVRIIQTARSEQDIEQSLSDLRLLLLRGGALVIVLALVGGWLITWGVLTAVRRMTRTAQSISASRNFSQRVPSKAILGRDELATLAATFNEMLANLEEVYQRQQRFVADASHELRAPITSIRCNLDLLAKAPDLPPEEAQAALADAQAEADRMGRLVTDLLTLARADSTQHSGVSALPGKRRGRFIVPTADSSAPSSSITPKNGKPHSEQIRVNGYRQMNRQRQQVDLDSLLLEVFRQYQPVGENGINDMQRKGPRLLLQHTTPVRVYGDADQLKQVLVALLDNALKYTPYEGSVSLSLITSENSAIVKVSDTGIGILPEDLPHIFERFFRADRARTRDRGGSGLGLAIVQSIVREHQGTIEVVSTPGKETTFILKLPVAM